MSNLSIRANRHLAMVVKGTSNGKLVRWINIHKPCPLANGNRVCNTHFKCHMACREIFLRSLGMNPIANRLFVVCQRFRAFYLWLFLPEFDANLPLCNTQQGYSPRGEGGSPSGGWSGWTTQLVRGFRAEED
jgi:hypothetical protein